MAKKRPPMFTLEEAARVAARVGIDGHSIVSVDWICSVGGIPVDKVAWRSCKHHSEGSNPKNWINGMVNATVEGVATLDILQACCWDCNVKYRNFFGRGSQAAECYSRLRETAKAAGVRWPKFDVDGNEIGLAWPVSEGQINHPTNANEEPE